MSHKEKHIELTQKEESVLASATFIVDNITNPHTQRHMRYGFNRRLLMMQKSRIKMFEMIEEQGEEPIPSYALIEPIIYLNSYYSNLRGIFDNLAWALTYELKLTDPISEEPGRGSSRSFCDLFGEDFLSALSRKEPGLAKFLGDMKDWYLEIKNLRDPGAHRIPLTFVTSVLDGDDQKDYNSTIRKYNQKLTSLKNAEFEDVLGILDEAIKLRERAEAIGKFSPIIVASEASRNELRFAPSQLESDQQNLLEISTAVLGLFKKCLDATADDSE